MLDLNAIPVTFSGSATSTIGKLGVQVLVGIFLPSNWSGVGALNFNVSPVNDGVNFFPLKDESGTAVSFTATAAGTFYAISNLNQWAGVNMVQLVAAASQTCTVTLLVRTVGF
jgi:hypothetical protein